MTSVTPRASSAATSSRCVRRTTMRGAWCAAARTVSIALGRSPSACWLEAIQPCASRPARRRAGAAAPPSRIGGCGRCTGRGLLARARHRVELARELHRVLRPQRVQAAQVLVHPRAAPLERHAGGGVLLPLPAHPEPDVEAAAGEHVERAERFGQQRGSDERRADRGRAEPDAVGVAGHVRERDEGIEHGLVAEHALERPQRRVPEFLGEPGDAHDRVRGGPAPRHRQTESDEHPRQSPTAAAGTRGRAPGPRARTRSRPRCPAPGCPRRSSARRPPCGRS